LRHAEVLVSAVQSLLFSGKYRRPFSPTDFDLVVSDKAHRSADGNGRACRLQTRCALWPLSGGLWSVSRGLARRRDEYYERLDAADAPRQGDLDGRGNLSVQELRRWCEWFIGICEDQVSFMTRMFHLDGMKTRI
jgi:hypothetical protein